MKRHLLKRDYNDRETICDVMKFKLILEVSTFLSQVTLIWYGFASALK